jgi:hypothetical protein
MCIPPVELIRMVIWESSWPAEAEFSAASKISMAFSKNRLTKLHIASFQRLLRKRVV